MEKLTPILNLFESSYQVYKSKFKILTKLAALNFLIWFITLPFIGVFIALNYKLIFLGSFSSVSLLTGLLFVLIGILIAIILGLWIYASLFFAVKDANNETKIKEVMPASWHKIASLFWVSFLAGLFALLGFILFIVPGIIFSMWVSQAIYIFVFEDVKGIAALKKSRELVRGYWWPLFGRFFIIGILGMAISSIHFLGLGAIINVLFVAPFTIVCGYLIYSDLKKIKNI